MNIPRRQVGPNSQRGVALAFALMMLVIITVIGVTAMRSSIFELGMARNEEARLAALEKAQSIVDATMTMSSNLLVAGSVGETNCTSGYEYPDDNDPCDSYTVTLDDGLDDPTITTYASSRVERLQPEFQAPPAVIGSSITVFEAAQFSVEGTFDARSSRQGASTVAQGVMVLVATGQQGSSSSSN